MSHRTISYKEYYPIFLISPRWLAITLDTCLTIGSASILIALIVLFNREDSVADLIIFALILIIPLFLHSIFYKIRVYSDGILGIYHLGFWKTIPISEIKRISPIPIKTRFYNLTYYDCLLENGTTIRINIEDIDELITELKLYNATIQYYSHNHN